MTLTDEVLPLGADRLTDISLTREYKDTREYKGRKDDDTERYTDTSETDDTQKNDVNITRVDGNNPEEDLMWMCKFHDHLIFCQFLDLQIIFFETSQA